MSRDDLEDLDPFQLLDAEAARLDSCFASLADSAWMRPSRCTGWSVRDVLAHLAGAEFYNHACLNGDIRGFFAQLERAGIGGAGEFGDFNGWCVRSRRDLPVNEVLNEWHVASHQTRTRMRELGRGGMIETSVGPYPAGLQAFHYASEYATHADDIDAPVGHGEEPARTSWRARFTCLVLHERRSKLSIHLTERGSYLVGLGAATAELAPSDFVAAAVERLATDDSLDESIRRALSCLA